MFKKIMTLSLIIFSVAGCGLEHYPGGDLPPKARLSAVKVGDTKEKVLRVLGTPASENPPLPNGESFLIYAQNVKESQAFWDPKEVQRDVYVYYFNADNILTKQEYLNLSKCGKVAYDDKQTPVGGRDLSVFEQIAQNFGRYTAGGQDSSVRR